MKMLLLAGVATAMLAAAAASCGGDTITKVKTVVDTVIVVDTVQSPPDTIRICFDDGKVVDCNHPDSDP